MKSITNLDPKAVAEICGERNADDRIQTRLTELLQGTELPPELAGDIRIPLTPYLATPNDAVKYVLGKISESCIPARLMTYKKDKFVTVNPEKAQTVYPRIDCLRMTKKGLAYITEGLRLVSEENRATSDGNPIGSLPTLYKDMDLGTFYDDLCKLVIPDLMVVDVSNALVALSELDSKVGQTRAERYYTYIMAINQVYGPGVNIGGNEDPGFYYRVVYPALMKASDILNVNPISLDVGEIPTGKAARKISISLASICDLEQELGVQRV